MDERRAFCGDKSGGQKCLYLSFGVMLLLAESQQILLMEKHIVFPMLVSLCR